MPSPMSDAEIAEDRWEQVHGEVMYWSYGLSTIDPDAQMQRHASYEARDRDAALDGIERLSGGENSPEACEEAWEVFLAAVTAEYGRAGSPDFTIAGPDGQLYWVERIDRS